MWPRSWPGCCRRTSPSPSSAPVIGFCTLTLLNSANATLQLESDPALQGRVMALYMTIVMGGTPLGSPIIGWVGQHLGARWNLVIGVR